MGKFFNIRGGKTQNSSAPALCDSCAYATIINGQNGENILICSQIAHYPLVNPAIHFKVTECSEYVKKGGMDIHEMKRIAWEVRARKRGPVGYQKEKSLETIIVPPRKIPQEDELIEKIFEPEED